MGSTVWRKQGGWAGGRDGTSAFYSTTLKKRGSWALRPRSTTRRTGNGSEERWHYPSPEDLKASCHLNYRYLRTIENDCLPPCQPAD
ncbi:hypothetical protein AV530_012865 [Patagioenas fasciata monilis]|uniref:Uncharacterized protein n=1 Tax=Patagioenas fasciata monilis TaxID=372326 RepID=A0A1V4J977_PATFA|nr:hypothetical protein AV530_012865 [Patagioenas fasciata monilis]